MTKTQQKTGDPDQAAHDEIADKLVPALGLKLSTAERKALLSGKKVSLENRSLSEFGSMLVRAEALKHTSGETAIIKDLTHQPPNGSGPAQPTPFLKLACVKGRRVRCCLEVSWPPYIGINCSGTF